MPVNFTTIFRFYDRVEYFSTQQPGILYMLQRSIAGRVERELMLARCFPSRVPGQEILRYLFFGRLFRYVLFL